VTIIPNCASHRAAMANMAPVTSISHSQKSRFTHTLTHGITAFFFLYPVLTQHCKRHQASRAKRLWEVAIDASRRVAPSPLQQHARHRTATGKNTNNMK
jgi:hypothetical protein